MLLLLFGALMSRHIGPEMKLLLSARAWLHHESCQEKHCLFFSVAGFVLDAWSPACSYLHICINECRVQKTREFLSPHLPPFPLPPFFLPGHFQLASSSLAALSGWVLECAQFGDQSLPRSLLLHCHWLCEWVSVRKKKPACVCIIRLQAYFSVVTLAMFSQSLWYFFWLPFTIHPPARGQTEPRIHIYSIYMYTWIYKPEVMLIRSDTSYFPVLCIVDHRTLYSLLP